MPPLLILGMKVLGGLIGLTLVADELEREGREAGYKHGYWEGSIQTKEKLVKKVAEKEAERKKRWVYAIKLMRRVLLVCILVALVCILVALMINWLR